METKITLVCFNCGKKKDILISRPPCFAFELAQIANDADMLGILDLSYGRSLVFCDTECANNQKTKSGSFRIRPKRRNIEQ